MLVVACHDSTKPLVEQDGVEAFENSPFSLTFLLTELLPDIIGLGNEFIADVQSDIEQPGEFTHKIAQIKDGFVKILVSSDKMSAKAQLEMPWGGDPVTMDDIKRECKNTGVSFGLKRSRVERLLEKSFDAAPGELLEETVAYGLDPKHGKNAYFKPLIELFSDKLRKPMEMEGGKVDLKDLGQIDTVKPGEPIYQKFPLTLGKPGKNVLGELLPATPGKDAKLEVSNGTVIDESDENILLAKREGLARLIENRMEVDDVYTLPELTAKVGHVKFNGTVIVAGDVAPEMKIIATGDVIIGGFVESVSIRCRGELTVISGVSGKPLDEPEGDRQFNCLLESGNRVNISFANQVDIRAKRDVFVHRQLSHCNVVAASVKVGQGEVANGKLIGGHLFLSKGLETGSLGAPSDTVTSISLNRTYEVFKEKENLLWEKVEPYVKKAEQLKEKLKNTIGDDERNSVKSEIVKADRIVNAQNSKRKKLSEKRKDYMSAISILVNHTLYGGLKVTIGDKSTTNDRERGPSIIHLDEYQLVIEPKS
jgi:hypothetical protein